MWPGNISSAPGVVRWLDELRLSFLQPPGRLPFCSRGQAGRGETAPDAFEPSQIMLVGYGPGTMLALT
jgi:hypothetical protein